MMGKAPLCMVQYLKLLGTCRIPQPARDEVFVAPKGTSKHVIVAYKNEVILYKPTVQALKLSFLSPLSDTCKTLKWLLAWLRGSRQERRELSFFFLLWAAALVSCILRLDCRSDCCAPAIPSQSNASFITYYSLFFLLGQQLSTPITRPFFFLPLQCLTLFFLTVLHLEFV